MANVATSAPERKRRPIAVTQLKLQIPEIPGFHLYWFKGTPERLSAAIEAGYEYVDAKEVALNSFSIGGDILKTGNTDMGSRVSVAAGGEAEGGQALRLYLMKQRDDWWKEDRKLQEEQSERIVAMLRGGAAGDGKEAATRYVDEKRTKLPDMFTRKSH